MKLEGYVPVEFRPSEPRRRFSGPTSYKHAPPAGGENPRLITAAIKHLAQVFF